MLLVIFGNFKIQKSFELKKYPRKKITNNPSRVRVIIIHLIVEQIQKVSLHKIHFIEPYIQSKNKIHIELNLPNYAKKSDFKKAACVDIPKSAKETELATFKLDIAEFDIDKLKTVPDDLVKFCNVAKNDSVKKTIYDELVTKVNTIGTGGFVLKTQYNTDKSGAEKKIDDVDKKIPDISGLAEKTVYNAKITEIECKIPSINGLSTNTALNAV